MHGDFVRPSGKWYAPFVPGAADWQRIDVAQSKTIDADTGGGTYNPTSPIIIGGAGMRLAGVGVTGATTKTGGRIVTNGDVPVCNPRTRTLVVPLLACTLRVESNVIGSVSLRDEYWLTPVLGPRVWGLAIQNGLTRFVADVPKRYLHYGARIATLGLNYVITAKPAAVPASPPSIAVQSQDSGGVAAQMVPALPLGWHPTTSYALNSYVTPLSNPDTGLYYKATAVSGTHTSGGSEPAWPTVIGNTVTDNPGANQIVWTATGRSGTTRVAGVTPDSYWANGGVQTLALDTDTGAGANTVPVATAGTGTRYQLIAFNMDPTMVVTSLLIVYDTITTLGFE